jgi:hypothetical protein
MNDPHLNSMHLDFPRREEFRRAREAVLEARGLHTIAVEKQSFDKVGSSRLLPEQRDPAPADSDYWLLDQDGVYPLRVGVNSIGRLPDNDVVIQGPCVSRRHCAILVHAGDGCELYDVASKNGTYVNGLRLSGPTQLVAGDEIRMCDRQFIFMTRKRGDSP